MQNSANTDLNIRPEYDQVIQDIVDYVFDYKIETSETYETARHCLMDTLGCGILALSFPACTKLMGPISRANGRARSGYELSYGSCKISL